MLRYDKSERPVRRPRVNLEGDQIIRRPSFKVIRDWLLCVPADWHVWKRWLFQVSYFKLLKG